MERDGKQRGTKGARGRGGARAGGRDRVKGKKYASIT
jgi:hypothetical protein